MNVTRVDIDLTSPEVPGGDGWNRRAVPTDVDVVLDVVRDASLRMQEKGLAQWRLGFRRVEQVGGPNGSFLMEKRVSA